MKLNYKCYKEVILYKKEPLTFISSYIAAHSKFAIKYQLGKISRNKPYMPGIFVYDYTKYFAGGNAISPIDFKDFLSKQSERCILTAILECQCSKLKKLSSILDLYYLHKVGCFIKNFHELKQHIYYKKHEVANQQHISLRIYPLQDALTTILEIFPGNYNLTVVEYLKPIKFLGLGRYLRY